MVSKRDLGRLLGRNRQGGVSELSSTSIAIMRLTLGDDRLGPVPLERALRVKTPDYDGFKKDIYVKVSFYRLDSRSAGLMYFLHDRAPSITRKAIRISVF